mmetsp:Transcript_34271/g.77442  ORF Transcript_34271/g.77442 Transcript_34271/m.77442 type:complete len:250 (-) Transcript_34271:562-1311(-)
MTRPGSFARSASIRRCRRRCSATWRAAFWASSTRERHSSKSFFRSFIASCKSIALGSSPDSSSCWPVLGRAAGLALGGGPPVAILARSAWSCLALSTTSLACLRATRVLSKARHAGSSSSGLAKLDASPQVGKGHFSPVSSSTYIRLKVAKKSWSNRAFSDAASASMWVTVLMARLSRPLRKSALVASHMNWQSFAWKLGPNGFCIRSFSSSYSTLTPLGLGRWGTLGSSKWAVRLTRAKFRCVCTRGG